MAAASSSGVLQVRITDDAQMRTTVDLPPALHRRARELAAAPGISVSAVLAELTARGLAQLDEPLSLGTDPASGFPVLRLGRAVTAEQVAAALDE